MWPSVFKSCKAPGAAVPDLGSCRTYRLDRGGAWTREVKVGLEISQLKPWGVDKVTQDLKSSLKFFKAMEHLAHPGFPPPPASSSFPPQPLRQSQKPARGQIYGFVP